MPESIFRSSTMQRYQLFIQNDAAYDCMSKLGELGCIQFKDLNEDVNAFQRTFVSDVRRCDEMERKLRFLYGEVKKAGIPIAVDESEANPPQPKEFSNLESIFEKLEAEVRAVQDNCVRLKKNYLELQEISHLLTHSNEFFKDTTLSKNTVAHNYVKPDTAGDTNYSYLRIITGVIQRERMAAFERMIWRICHGNVYIRESTITKPLEDPKTGESITKSVFILFYYGDQLVSRIQKVCHGFHATIHDIPDSHADRLDMSAQVYGRIAELETVLQQTREHELRVLTAVAQRVMSWVVQVQKSKAIYHTLNMFNADMVHQKCLIGEAWIPAECVDRVQLALVHGRRMAGTDVPQVLTLLKPAADDMPPTLNRTNKFTKAFQVLVDSYGVNAYKEMNPAPYACVTFPFLFSLMFSDFGHGLIMTSFAAWMILNEMKLMAKKSTNEIWNIFFAGRYIILMMGLFSVHSGLIFNDMFGKSMNIFGSKWRSRYDLNTVNNHHTFQMDPKDAFLNDPYPFGIDPIWSLSHDNKIVFLNSFKMKLSIIFGVSQMLFGVFMSLTNFIYFKDYVSIFLQFIPQIIFMCAIFVYLAILMFIKWFMYSTFNSLVSSETCAPQILITFINMMMFRGSDLKDPNCETPYIYANEEIIQKILLLIGLLCVPIMLLGKPCMEKRKRDREMKMGIPLSTHGEESELSELFIHQAISTIEYVLGSVSHTASYLRLWALSLAHAQLSDVLWERVFNTGLHMASTGWLGTFALIPVFIIWASLTIAILVLMEGLSAFLHTLRLHWVEFQSKFYEGSGMIFAPLSFDKCVANQLARLDEAAS